MRNPKVQALLSKATKVLHVTGALLGLSVVTLTLGAGCTSSTRGVTETPDATHAQVLTEVLVAAQSECSIRTPPDAKAAFDTGPRVFIEAFFVELPKGAPWRLGANSLSDIAKLAGAKLVASPHIIAPVDQPATMDLGTRIMPPDATLDAGIHFKRLTALPRLGRPGEVIVELDVAVDTLDPEQAAARSSPVEVHVRNTFVAHERKAAVLHTELAGYSAGSLLLLVKPYVVTSEIDLRDIFTCKMQERQRTLMRRGSTPSGS